MAIDYKQFIHPSDKKSLDSLKAVPGFDMVIKKVVELVAEKSFKLTTTAQFLKLGPNQMPEIYGLLVKICIKLEIKVPELYLSLDRSVNAYTMGDTEVFIVLHSGCLETLTLEEIETILAHECGHILCHHSLYHTAAAIILGTAEYFASGFLAKAAITSLQYSFKYWSRCSEFSADRVSAYYHNSPEPVVNLMLSFAGATNNLPFKPNPEEFLKQAANYLELIDNSTYNKILEFVQFGYNTHPLIAYRAYEIVQFFTKNEKLFLKGETKQIPTYESDKVYTITIDYVYVKPVNILKLGGVFDAGEIEIEVNDKNYKLGKNSRIAIELNGGIHTLKVWNSKKKEEKNILVNDNKIITIKWDSQENDFYFNVN